MKTKRIHELNEATDQTGKRLMIDKAGNSEAENILIENIETKAENQSYDNTNSGLTADNTQSAIDELKTLIDARVRWLGNWQEITYEKNDLVLDDNWLCIANKQTVERAAPQNDGDPSNVMIADPAYDENSSSGIVETSHRFTMKNEGWLREVYIWIKDLTPDTHYRIQIKDVTNPDVILIQTVYDPLLVVDQWNTVKVGDYVCGIDTVIEVSITASNAGSSTNISGGWTYGGSGTVLTPNSQEWVKNNQETWVRISKIDLDSVDRTTELMGIIPESILRFVQTNDTTRYLEFVAIANPVDAGTYIEIEVQQIGGASNLETGEANTVDIEIPIPQTAKWAEKVDYFPAGSVDFCDIITKLEIDGVDQGASKDTAYGIDILYQKANISDDWDIISNFSRE